jgi:RNA polymerase sigma-70 factor (ECF subfamily)
MVAVFRESFRGTLAGEADDTLERLLAGVVARARAAWPALATGADALIAHLAPRLSADLPAREALERVAAGDLYLACACLRGEAAALAALVALVDDETARAIARLGLADAGDLAASLRERLLLGGDRGARLHGYTGRGDLRAWVRVAALREALQAQRRLRREVSVTDDRLIDATTAGDPELAHVAARYRGELEAAFLAALAALASGERTLLRLHYLRGLTLDEMGAALGVHRATAARRIAGARDRLLALTRGQLRARLGVAEDELSSLIRVLRGQLDLSLRRLGESDHG